MKNIIKKIENKIGNMKVGLVLLGLLIVILVFGSFLESVTSAQFVDRLIYSTFWFKFFIGCITLVIVISLINKVSFQYKYLGFYFIHVSLILILAGGLLTSYTGINGDIVLYPNSPTDQIDLNDHELVIYSGDDIHNLNPIKTISLPLNAYAWNTDIEIFPQTRFRKYLPFYETSLKFGNDNTQNLYFSAFFELEINKQLGEIALSNHPDSPTLSRSNFQGIHFTLLPKVMLECYTQKSDYDFFFWDRNKQMCFIPPKETFTIGTSKLGNRFIDYKYDNKSYKYWPEMSPRPMREHGVVIPDADIFIMSKIVSGNSEDILLFDNILITRQSGEKEYQRIELSNEWASVNHLDLKIRIKQQESKKPILNIPQAVIPNQTNQNQPAVLIEHNDFNHWVYMDNPLVVNHLGKILKLSLEKKKAKMPFKIKLQKFEMKLYPESQMPASFESFLEVDKGQFFNINMNNPLSYKGFRLFQSSYFQLTSGEYVSVLSVSRDPGRWPKYLGSFLLLFGLVYYYFKKRII